MYRLDHVTPRGCGEGDRLHAEAWPPFSRFLDDGRICLTNNAAERALRGIALGRKAWLFAGSNRGGERAAAVYLTNRCSVDADRGIGRFMPPAELCRTVPE